MSAPPQSTGLEAPAATVPPRVVVSLDARARAELYTIDLQDEKTRELYMAYGKKTGDRTVAAILRINADMKALEVLEFGESFMGTWEDGDRKDSASAGDVAVRSLGGGGGQWTYLNTLQSNIDRMTGTIPSDYVPPSHEEMRKALGQP